MIYSTIAIRKYMICSVVVFKWPRVEVVIVFFQIIQEQILQFCTNNRLIIEISWGNWRS